MLQEFLQKERDKILERAKEKAKTARWGRLASGAVDEGWEVFFDELTAICNSCYISPGETDDGRKAFGGTESQKLGFAITEAVEAYNILYQAIVESASDSSYEIDATDLRNLSVSLDRAIAQAVTHFEEGQLKLQNAKEGKVIGFLAHELRNCLQSATIAVEMVESGAVDFSGPTGKLIHTSHARMAELIDSALTSVRLQLEPAAHLERVRAFDVISEVEITAAYQARARDLELCIEASNELEAIADRQLLTSALSNLVQNAIKFSQPNGTVTVRAGMQDDRVVIEVEDECGGLPEGKIQELFTPGVQRGKDRTGVGLGLAIAREALEKNRGSLRVRDLPGKGCIFTIELPQPM